MNEKIPKPPSAWEELTGGMDYPGWDKRMYFFERYESISKGESTWLAQNFDSDGLCFVYYVDKQPVGRLHIGGWDSRGL